MVQREIDYVNRSKKFLLNAEDKKDAFERQYCHIYVTRLDAMKMRILEAAKKELGRDKMKLAERIASILQDFELRQLEIEEVEKLEVVEEEDHEFQPEEDCATPLTSEGTITFSGGQIVSEENVWLC
ncbi:unnamed protein product [Heligmosomoides polygyrus]|uniref:ING domain-containing protein n=1 Tax=Heligmosomoides polygyrus TaxID=6339 RepID=A0A183GBI9_HELPZ|nr:unnamed protein product [Heligmosomoides polygyrus]